MQTIEWQVTVEYRGRIFRFRKEYADLLQLYRDLRVMSERLAAASPESAMSTRFSESAMANATSLN